MTRFYEGEDIEGASAWLKEASWRAGGVSCPCCGRHTQVYKRPLSGDMARFMVFLVCTWLRIPAERREWIDIQHFDVRGGDYAKVVHWKLAEVKENDSDPDKKSSGLWRPTQLGIDFVLNRVEVPSHVFLYLNEVVGHSEQQVYIREAIGKKFSYEELMNA